MLELLARHPYLRELVFSTLIGLGVYAVCALVVIVVELTQQQDMSVYRTPGTLNDLAYAVFYRCSIYNILVIPVFSFLSPRLQFLHTSVLMRLPPMVSLVVCWIVFDFLNYWTHRLLHAVRPLWAFHSLHHAQTQLTFLSANRIHAIEQLSTGVLIMIPALLLGLQQRLWLPLLFAQLFSETIQHARLTWSFGPLHRLIVSPSFHAVHHSSDEREHNANYGRFFSLWDVLFGTFKRPEMTKRRFGVDGMNIPERLTAQFAHPFRYLANSPPARLDRAREEV